MGVTLIVFFSCYFVILFHPCFWISGVFIHVSKCEYWHFVRKARLLAFVVFVRYQWDYKPPILDFNHPLDPFLAIPHWGFSRKSDIELTKKSSLGSIMLTILELRIGSCFSPEHTFKRRLSVTEWKKVLIHRFYLNISASFPRSKPIARSLIPFSFSRS